MTDKQSYIEYRGYYIEQRRRWNKKDRNFRTFGYYVGNKYFSSMSDAQIYIDDLISGDTERRLWDDSLEGYFD